MVRDPSKRIDHMDWELLLAIGLVLLASLELCARFRSLRPSPARKIGLEYAGAALISLRDYHDHSCQAGSHEERSYKADFYKAAF